MRALVTGACGFAGSHLVHHLLESGDKVIAVMAPGESDASLDNVRSKITFETLDIRDQKGCDRLLKRTAPDTLFHLAAIAFLPDAQADPSRLFSINLGGTATLAQAILDHSPATKMVYISSAEVYGIVDESQMPVVESQPVRPVNMYAFSKSFSEDILLDLMDRKGLDLVICRPFTHIGPRQSRQFAASNFSWQISQIEKGKQPPYIQVGNLSSKRDIIDVSDMVRAYRMSALLSGAPGPFNLCSKKVISMKDMLDLLISMSSVPIEVQIDPNRFRSVDIPIYLGDPERFQAITGWKAKIPLETTLQQLLDYWRLIAK